jgi:hypothetical protein
VEEGQRRKKRPWKRIEEVFRVYKRTKKTQIGGLPRDKSRFVCAMEEIKEEKGGSNRDTRE